MTVSTIDVNEIFTEITVNDEYERFMEFVENNIRISHLVEGKIPLTLNDFQIELAKYYFDNKHTIAKSERQSGKTTVGALICLWFAMFHPNSTILVVTDKSIMYGEIINTIKYFYESIDNASTAKIPVFKYDKSSIEFANGSKIVGRVLNKDVSRGLSVQMLYMDEVGTKISNEVRVPLLWSMSKNGKSLSLYS